MRFLRFICWLRGYHANGYKITRLEGTDVFGDAFGPCICGKFAPEGKVQGSYTVVVWPLNPKLVEKP